jgi:hypothetical protein
MKYESKLVKQKSILLGHNAYEKVMTETVMTCLLNPRATWQLSWGRIATWGRPWRRCVQRGDVLIINSIVHDYRTPKLLCIFE